MKAKILFILLLISVHVCAREKRTGGQVTIVNVEKSGENLEISFTLLTGTRAVKSNHTLYLLPVLAHPREGARGQ